MGYVGLTLSAVMADHGFDVYGIEINPTVLAAIREGRGHFYEANLDSMLRRGLRRGRLHFSDRVPEGVHFDVFIITVGTPLDAEGRSRTDMIENVVRNISARLQPGAMVILRSTVKLGTTLGLVKPILDGAGVHFDIAFCPERTIEGRALSELVTLPQIVGGQDEHATIRATNLFRRLTPTVVRVSNIAAAELIKLLDNSFRDLSFAFGNEVALMCEALKISGREVIEAANMGYARTNIAKPGFVGGPCLEKDPHILVESMDRHAFVPRMVATARALNESLVTHVFQRVLEAVPKREGLVVSLLGLAFKGQPDTDDLRGSTAIPMVRLFQREIPGAVLRGQDYVCSGVQIRSLGIEPVDDFGAFEGADIVLVMNNNRRYYELDIEERVRSMNRPGLVFDCWNVFASNLDLPDGVSIDVFGR